MMRSILIGLIWLSVGFLSVVIGCGMGFWMGMK
jgi:hypothetical protein